MENLSWYSALFYISYSNFIFFCAAISGSKGALSKANHHSSRKSWEPSGSDITPFEFAIALFIWDAFPLKQHDS